MTLNRSILNGSPIAPLPPHIQPPYYAAIIAAEAIGSSGNAQIVEISVNATDISGYAVFEYGTLARAVFLNNVAYLPGAGVRNSTHINIDLSGTGWAAQQMKVKRLNIPYGRFFSAYKGIHSRPDMQMRLLASLGEGKRMKQPMPGLVEPFRKRHWMCAQVWISKRLKQFYFRSYDTCRNIT